MVIQSLKTGQNHTVSPAQWETLKAKGKSRFYKIVEQQPEQPKQPDEYETLLKRANRAYKDEKWAVSFKLFKQVKEMKETPYVDKKLTELAEKLEKPNEK